MNSKQYATTQDTTNMFQVTLVQKEDGFEVDLPTIKKIYSIIHKLKHKHYDASTKRWFVESESLNDFCTAARRIASVNVYYKDTDQTD